MKLAAAEAMWESEQPASLSLLTIGDLSFTREVFSIRLPYAMSLLTCNNLTCEVRGMDDIQAELEAKHEFPFDIWKKAGELGFLGIIFPEELGGAGLGYVEYVLVITELSKVDPSVGISVAAHNSLSRTIFEVV